MTWEEETDSDMTPAEVIRMHGCLKDAVAPLVALLSVHPLNYRVALAVVELAMVMGIHAAERTQALENERSAFLQYGIKPYNDVTR